MSPEIAIIVPVFNEQDNVLPMLGEVAAALNPTGRTWELIFVDDGSTDATWRRIAEARALEPRVRGLRHTRNAGQSAAVWTGIRNTSAAILATLDGDLQNDPAEIPRLLPLLNGVDFVCGDRSANRRDSALRRVSSAVARWFRKLVLGYDFRDTGCALRVFKRECVTDLAAFNGWHRFLPILVAGSGWKTREVPVSHRPRLTGVSKYGVWNRLWRGLYDLIGVGWLLKRRLRSVPVERLD
ncbi:MAG: glycosyltransferase family 2 protein [Verrucomicrobia bacterium]|nr:glycosyltransferase family 2 protein [Verrucomicrobiota bacterium]